MYIDCPLTAKIIVDLLFSVLVLMLILLCYVGGWLGCHIIHFCGVSFYRKRNNGIAIFNFIQYYIQYPAERQHFFRSWHTANPSKRSPLSDSM